MKILVLRRHEEGIRTAGKIRALGHEPLLLPIFRLEQQENGIEQIRQAGGGAWDALALTSAATLEAFPDIASVIGPSLPVHAVGERTAQAARAAGFSDVVAADGDGAALAVMLRESLGREGRTARILHPHGEAMAFDIAASLAETGIEVTSVVIYRVNLSDPGRERLEEALRAAQGGMALHYSRESAAAFFMLVERHGLETLAVDLAAAAISPSTAAAIPAGLASRIEIAKMPSEAAMMDILRSLP